MMLLLAWTGAARATQVTISGGTSTSYSLPFNMWYNYSLTQQIYTAEELGGAGTITSISFHYAYSSPFTMNGVQVYLKEVDKSSFVDVKDFVPLSASDKVFEGTFSASGAGWVTITLDTPFEYSGTKNLLVGCYDPTSGNTGSSSYKFYCTQTENQTSLSYFSDSNCPNLNNLTSYASNRTTYGYRCNIKFDISQGTITKSLTVCDGTVTNTCVPVDGYYTDWYQKSEFIIPANKLLQLEDNTISKMTFYLSSPASGSWGSAKFKVFLKEVDATTISNYYGTTGATTVYEGPLDGTKSTMDIEFTTPYLYHGGNLLVGVYQTTKGTDNSATFIGSTASNASIFGMNDSNLDNVSINYENFIPKTTFDYYYETNSACPMPQNLTVTDIDFWDATVSWTSDAAQWDLRYKSTYDSNWIRVEGLTSPTYSFNELLNYSGTKYEVQVRSNCGGGDVSDWVSTSFVTTICDENNRGAISYELTDSYGDGWNGNAIDVVHSKTGLVVATLDMTKDDGKMKKGTIDLCFGEDYDFVWLKGDFSEECSFTIKDNFGEDIIACQKCDALQPGLITTFGVSWYQWSGKRPTNLAIAEGPGPDRVTLTWTPGSENQTTWDFSYSKEGDMSEAGVENVHTTSPRYVFTGLDRYPLEPNTTYRVKVRSNASNDGGMSDWSNIITFTTSGENPIPSQVNVETTFVQATINWVGYSYCYDVKYRKKGDSYWNVYRTGVYGNTQNTYNLTGLDPETEYEYQIVGIAYPNVANAGTAIATFKTKAFTAPKQLTVSDVTPNAATVSWTSFASTVALQYATVPDNVNVGSGWHYYDDGEPQTSVGTSGGRFSWGIMIPAGTYSGSVLNKVSVYDCVEMEGTITIYNVNGTLPSDADVVGSPKNITLTGAKEFVDFDMGNLSIDSSKDLWVILTNESGAGYPAAVSNDVNGDPNGRWVSINGNDWMDLSDAGAPGYTFMVRAYIEGNVDPLSLTWNTVSSPSSPQTLTNLSNNKQYAVRVQAKEGSTLESEWVMTYFKTLPDNPVPFDLKAEPAENTATISWNGYSTSYNLRYRTAAQERKIFFDDFENGMDKWTIIRNEEGTENTDWHAIDLSEMGFYYSAHSGDYVAVTRSWTSTNIYTVENWLITPKVTLDGTLRFWVMDDGTYHEHYDVYVSTTTNDISAFTLLASPGNASGLWKEVTVDLSSFHGQKGYIALRHQDTDQDILMIDDFGIYGIGVPASSWTTSKNLSGKSILLGGLDPQTTYEYQLQGVKGSATSEWSPIAQFTTLEAENAIATDIQTIDHGQRTVVKGQKDVWYTIDGQKLSGKPTKKGMYIYNGKVVVN